MIWDDPERSRVTLDYYTWGFGFVAPAAMALVLVFAAIMRAQLVTGLAAIVPGGIALGLFQSKFLPARSAYRRFLKIQSLDHWPPMDQFAEDLKKAATIGKYDEFLDALTYYYHKEYAGRPPNSASDETVLKRYRELVRRLAQSASRW